MIEAADPFQMDFPSTRYTRPASPTCARGASALRRSLAARCSRRRCAHDADAIRFEAASPRSRGRWRLFCLSTWVGGAKRCRPRRRCRNAARDTLRASPRRVFRESFRRVVRVHAHEALGTVIFWKCPLPSDATYLIGMPRNCGISIAKSYSIVPGSSPICS